MASNSRCLLLELPAELRNRIYEYVLAPTGTIALTRSKTKRFATDPVLGPTLLRSCRQIYQEAVDVLYSCNTVCIGVDAQDNRWPTISEARLPQRALEKLQHIFVVLICVNRYFWTCYSEVDWEAFSALISLKTIRLTSVELREDEHEETPVAEASRQKLLTQVMERIPADTLVSFGTQPGSAEHAFTKLLMEAHQQLLPTCVVVEGDAQLFSSMVGSLPAADKGCRSGGIEDVFAEYRRS